MPEGSWLYVVDRGCSHIPEDTFTFDLDLNLNHILVYYAPHLCPNTNKISQRMTKPTIRHVRLAKDQTAHPRSLIRVFADCMCPLQPPGYPKRVEEEHLPY